MITIKQDIPSLVFSGNLPDLEFTTSKSAVTVELTTGGVEVYSQQLTPTAQGRVTLRNMQELVLPYIDHTLQGSFHLRLDDGEQEVERDFRVLYCRAELPMEATQYCEERFFTTLYGAKEVFLGNKEWLYYYVTATILVSITVRYLVDGELEEEERWLSAGTLLNVVRKLNVSPYLFEADGKTLLGYTVSVGDREQEYVVVKDPTSPLKGFLFTNSFGCQESIYLTGTLELSPQLTYSATYMEGKYRAYQVDEVRQFTVSTGALSFDMAHWVEDFLRSRETYLLLGVVAGKEITITEAQADRTDDPSFLPMYSITYRYSQANHNLVHLKVAGRVFDYSFDKTLQ